MSDAYRETTLLCPACATALDPRLLQDAEVDVCGRCKGVWIDWFDGELQDVAIQAAPLSMPGSVIPVPTSASCPHCRRPMALQPYGVGGPALWRCGECAGAFVPRASFEALTLLLEDPQKPASESAEEGSVFARMLAVLRRLLKGPAPGEPAEGTEPSST